MNSLIKTIKTGKQVIECNDCLKCMETIKQLNSELSESQQLIHVLTRIHITARKCIDEMDDIIETLITKLSDYCVHDFNNMRSNEELLLQQLLKSEECLEQLRYKSNNNNDINGNKRTVESLDQSLSQNNHNFNNKRVGIERDPNERRDRLRSVPELKTPQKLCYRSIGSNVKKKFKCFKCFKVYASMNSLRKHEKLHNLNKQIRCHFPNCNKTFRSNNYLLLHLKYHKRQNLIKINDNTQEYNIDFNIIKSEANEDFNNSDREFILPQILIEDNNTLEFENRDQMKADIEEHELLVNPNDFLDETQTEDQTEDQIEEQMKRKVNDNSLECSECGQWFRKDYLPVHLRIHTGEKPYVCEFPDCGKRFAQTSSRNQHFKTHTGERSHKCLEPNCGREFSKRCNYLKHVNSHYESEEPIRKKRKRIFKCRYPNCGKAFGLFCVLQRHEVIHTGIKEFKCNHYNCNYESYWKENLRDHYKRRHNEIFIV